MILSLPELESLVICCAFKLILWCVVYIVQFVYRMLTIINIGTFVSIQCGQQISQSHFIIVPSFWNEYMQCFPHIHVKLRFTSWA